MVCRRVIKNLVIAFSLTFIPLTLVVSGTRGDKYDDLVRRIDRKYKGRKARYFEDYGKNKYRYEIRNVEDFPTWCSEKFPADLEGFPEWITKYGPVLLKADEGAYVCVRSWIERSPERGPRVSRIFFCTYVNGNWKIANTTRIVEDWTDEYGWVCRDLHRTLKN